MGFKALGVPVSNFGLGDNHNVSLPGESAHCLFALIELDGEEKLSGKVII